ncbi:MAG: hypothetical protein E6P95_01885 [Candidatus Moraniibacteriota bacterium]|nr:MAG: hypothetical protein E6P95_01885 [Candidatus Moranbacteria bacterium]
MGLFSRFVAPQSKAPSSHLDRQSTFGRHPSSRSANQGGIEKPEPIGKPHDVLPGRQHDWTPRRLQKFEAGIDTEYGYMKSGVAAAVRETINEGSGANHQFSGTEMKEVAADLQEHRLALGLTTDQATKITNDLLAGPKE